MNYTDYPCSFKTSDETSLSCQKNHIVSSVIHFGLLIFAALFSSFVFDVNNNLYRIFAWGIIISLFLALTLKLVMKIIGWDKQWYDSRAIAESMKTVTWRYVTGANPFGLEHKQDEIDKKFIEEVDSIIKSRPSIQRAMSTCLASGKQISDRMREVRKITDIEEKKKLYLKGRVEDQKNWYSKKAKYNGWREQLWFVLIIIAEVLAILLAFYMLNAKSNIFNPIGLITTLAGIFVAWTETKRFRELSQSYTLAAQELASAASLIENVHDQTSLAIYVDDTENAISREHTMWCAKRS
jgi:hypothetical protein